MDEFDYNDFYRYRGEKEKLPTTCEWAETEEAWRALATQLRGNEKVPLAASKSMSAMLRASERQPEMVAVIRGALEHPGG